jgi:hypothetical protein
MEAEGRTPTQVPGRRDWPEDGVTPGYLVLQVQPSSTNSEIIHDRKSFGN